MPPQKVIVDCEQFGKPGVEIADAMLVEAARAAQAGDLAKAGNIVAQADRIRADAGTGPQVTYVDLTPEEIAQQAVDAVAGRLGAIRDARARRTAMLRETDWTQLADAPLANGARAAWTAYRQALRDLGPAIQADPAGVAWPAPPS